MGAAADLGWPLVADTDLVRNLPAELTTLADAIGAMFQNPWTAFVPTICRGDTGAALPTSSANGWYKRFGKTIFAVASATSTNATPAGAGTAITLPLAAKNRLLECGTCHVWGAAVPAGQSGVALMSADLLRINVVAFTAGLLDVAAGASVRYSVMYELP